MALSGVGASVSVPHAADTEVALKEVTKMFLQPQRQEGRWQGLVWRLWKVIMCLGASEMGVGQPLVEGLSCPGCWLSPRSVFPSPVVEYLLGTQQPDLSQERKVGVEQRLGGHFCPGRGLG